MRTKLCLLSAVLVCAGLNVGLNSAVQASDTDAQSDCEIEYDPTSLNNESWLDDTKAQDVVSSVAEAVTKVFGSVTTLKEDPLALVKQGYVGTAIDDDAHQLVVVVDPDSDAWKSVAEALKPSMETGLARLEASCVPTSALVDAGQKLVDRKSIVGAIGDTYGVGLSPYTSQWEVTVNGTEAAAKRAEASLGDDISVSAVPGEIGRMSGSRTADAQPHWSGAFIRNNPTGSGCTSGIVVDTASSGKAILTAGHCWAVGTTVESGPYAYGSVTRRPDYPQYDIEVINASTQDYDDDIYANPVRAVGNPYDVSGTRTPGVGAKTCLSGQVSHTECNLLVVDLSDWLCDTAGCTYGLFRFDPLQLACKGGDSGGPVFAEPDATHHARIDGSLVGGKGTGCLAEYTASIEYALNVTVATSP